MHCMIFFSGKDWMDLNEYKVVKLLNEDPLEPKIDFADLLVNGEVKIVDSLPVCSYVPQVQLGPDKKINVFECNSNVVRFIQICVVL